MQNLAAKNAALLFIIVIGTRQHLSRVYTMSKELNRELTQLEADVICHRYGIEVFNEENFVTFTNLCKGKLKGPVKSISEVSHMLCMNETMVYALEKNALRKLQLNTAL